MLQPYWQTTSLPEKNLTQANGLDYRVVHYEKKSFYAINNEKEAAVKKH